MAEEAKPVVEDKTQIIPPQEQKPEEKDFTIQLAEKDANIAKLTKEKDDFKKGMDLWRARAKENREAGTPMSDIEIEELAERKAREAVLNSELGVAVKEKDDLITTMGHTISELKNALKNKPGPSIAAGGSAGDEEVKSEFFTKEQLDDLKSRGIDPNKVIANLKNASTKAPITGKK